MNQNQIDILNSYLSNIKVLNNNLYNLHFNVVDDNFFTLHKKYQEYYEYFAEVYDAVAERIKMLGGFPITSLTQYENISTIKSMPSCDYSGEESLQILANDFSYMIGYSKQVISELDAVGDSVSSGLISDALKFFEKQLWMVRSSL